MTRVNSGNFSVTVVRHMGRINLWKTLAAVLELQIPFHLQFIPLRLPRSIGELCGSQRRIPYPCNPAGTHAWVEEVERACECVSHALFSSASDNLCVELLR